MRLRENPVFLTYSRLCLRGALRPAVVVTAVVAVVVLLSLVNSLEGPSVDTEETVLHHLGLLLILEAVVLIAGVYSRVLHIVARERAVGLLDANTLAPLAPTSLVAGFVFGSSMVEGACGAVLALAALLLGATNGVPFFMWLLAQGTLASLALLSGLIGAAAGLTVGATARVPGMLVLLVLFLCLGAGPGLVPTQPILEVIDFFADLPASDATTFFSLPVAATPLSLACLLLLAAFLLYSTKRKLTTRASTPWTGRAALAFFASVAFLQSGLFWSIWNGMFPYTAFGESRAEPGVGYLVLLALLMAHGHAIDPGLVSAGAARGCRNVSHIAARSAPMLSFALCSVLSLALAPHAIRTFDQRGGPFLLTVASLLTFSCIAPLVVDLSRLALGRRWVGGIAVGVTLLFGAPLLLTTLLEKPTPSLFAPGVPVLVCLSHRRTYCDVTYWRLAAVATHAALVVVLSIAWFWRVRALLRSSGEPQP